ncbi:MAG: hydroxymethylbilane synthase [Planctomycetota bacterium]
MTISPSHSAIRIATRDSPLAMWQAEFVADQLTKSGHEVDLVPLVSTGDVDMRPIDGTRQVGVFTKRIQQALVDNEADVAVHSLKDLPTAADDRFHLAAIPRRGEVRDSLVTSDGCSLADLPDRARVGTGSMRRRAQLLSHRADLCVSPIRGNVQTRLEKLASGEFDAIVLAEAGLIRLGLSDVRRSVFDLDVLLPAPGQGALGIEVRRDDQHASDALNQIDDLATHACVVAERAALSSLDGGCLAPIAAHGSIRGDQLNLAVIVLSYDGRNRLAETMTDTGFSETLTRSELRQEVLKRAAQLGIAAGNALLEAGAAELIQTTRDVTGPSR